MSVSVAQRKSESVRPCSGFSTRSCAGVRAPRTPRRPRPPAPLGRAHYSPVFEDLVRPPNTAWFISLNAQAAEFFRDWETIASDAVAILRAEAGRDPYDRRLTELIGELSTRSDEFHVRWAAQREVPSRWCQDLAPLVGDLTLSYEALKLPATPDNTSSSTRQSPTRHPTRPSTLSAAGRPRRDPTSQSQRSQQDGDRK